MAYSLQIRDKLFKSREGVIIQNVDVDHVQTLGYP